MADLLTNDELAKWALWKRATDAVMADVATAIFEPTGLSGPDFAVLTRLVEEGQGSLRQQRLSDDLQWGRSRLSRHLARMEARGLVARDGTDAQRRITATEQGRRLVARARPAHAAAVRRHLLDPVTRNAGSDFWRSVEQIARTNK